MEQEESSRNPYESPGAPVADISPPLGRSATLSAWVRWLLIAQIFILVVAVVSSLLERQLLADYAAGIYAGRADEATAAGNLSDLRQGIIGVAQSLLYLTCDILILVWIRRANAEARRLGAEGMEFTPGWAIGWYFIPFANLLKPYQAMREIWQASADPKHWRQETWSALLPWWWFFWIVSNIFANASLRFTLRAASLDQLMTVNTVTLASDAIDIPLFLLFLAIVSRIDRMQSVAGVAAKSAVSGEALGSV